MSGSQVMQKALEAFEDNEALIQAWADAGFLKWGSLKPKGCAHEWVPYTGLTEVYDFCKFCDSKRKDE